MQREELTKECAELKSKLIESELKLKSSEREINDLKLK